MTGPRVQKAKAVTLAVLIGAGVAIGVGCTFLVQFEDAPKDGGPIDDLDAGNGGGDDGAPLEDVVEPPPDALLPDGGNPCMGQADGFNWFAGNKYARCCAGEPKVVNTNDDCGICGKKCNTALGQFCGAQNGHFMCRGCVNNNDCWSKCCSVTYTPHNCTPNDPCGQGSCDANLCPGALCLTQDGGSNYCAYP